MRSAKIFGNGQNQGGRSLKEYPLKRGAVAIRRIGDAAILQPHDKGWDTLFDALGQFSPDFMGEREQASVQDREAL